VVLATEERNASARQHRDTPEGLCQRTHEHVVREAARSSSKPRSPRTRGRSAQGSLGALIEDTIAGRRWHS
jgi:hypothetical protein